MFFKIMRFGKQILATPLDKVCRIPDTRINPVDQIQGRIKGDYRHLSLRSTPQNGSRAIGSLIEEICLAALPGIEVICSYV
jgi:hypothetical protein